MTKHTLSIKMTRGELIFGWIWLLVQHFLLPYAVAMAMVLLKLPLSDLWLNFLLFCLNFLVVCIAFRKYLAKSLRRLGKHFLHCLGTCVLGFVLYWAASILVGIFIAVYFPNHTNANNANIAQMAAQQYWIMATGSVLLVPLFEEVLYRGVLFGTFDRLSRPAAYLFSALLFSAVHVVGYIGQLTPAQAVVSLMQYLPASLCLAWAYAESDTIFSPVLIHMAINAIAISSMR